MKTVSIGPGMDGARVALPVWMRILEKMKEKGQNRSEGGFRRPSQRRLHRRGLRDGLEGDVVDSPRPILEAFVSGSQPTEEWNTRWEEITRLPWSLQKSFYLPKKGEAERGRRRDGASRAGNDNSAGETELNTGRAAGARFASGELRRSDAGAFGLGSV